MVCGTFGGFLMKVKIFWRFAKNLNFSDYLIFLNTLSSELRRCIEMLVSDFCFLSGHGSLVLHLSKPLNTNNLIVEFGAGDGTLHKFAKLRNYKGVNADCPMIFAPQAARYQ